MKKIIIRTAMLAVLLAASFAVTVFYPHARPIIKQLQIELSRAEPQHLVSSSDEIILLREEQSTFDLILHPTSAAKLEQQEPQLTAQLRQYFHWVTDTAMEPTVILLRAKDVSRLQPNVSLSDFKLAGASAGRFDIGRYPTAAHLLADGRISLLKSKDYYIHVSFGEISVVCGSTDVAAQALTYLTTKYIDQGRSQGGNFLVTEPKTEVCNGSYIDCTIAEVSATDYALVYHEDSQYYDSEATAQYLCDYFTSTFGQQPVLSHNGNFRPLLHKLIIGKTEDKVSAAYYAKKPDVWDYSIQQSGRDFYILGGSDIAIRYAADYLIDNYWSKGLDLPKGFLYRGNLRGQCLFDPYDGANLRIMSSNIWHEPRNQPAWQEKGEDCTQLVRLYNTTATWMACEPDILCLQETEPLFIPYIKKMLKDMGGSYQSVADQHVGRISSNYTPILYNTKRLTLLDAGSHVFIYASNNLSKSYTWGYFRLKDSDETFLVFSTHLWWMGQNNAVFPGTETRTAQINEIMAEADKLIKQYECPCFVLGDMNCTTLSEEYGTWKQQGFTDCHNIATAFADNVSGRYVCGPGGFSYKPSEGTYIGGALDHAVVKHLDDNEVVAYDYVTPNFYGKLSDHAPLYIDVRLGDSMD